MNNRLIFWCNEHREHIESAIYLINGILSLVVNLSIRTILAAAAIVGYLFYTATPDTTIYQLSQFAHKDGFWFVAFLIACVYTIMLFSIHGPSHKASKSTGYAAAISKP